MLALTENAVEAIEGILAAPTVPDGAGVRIAPVAAADSEGAELQITIAGAPNDSDQVIDEGGARLFVDDAATDFLQDKLLDASIVGQEVRFMIGDQAEE
jgi:iron-sulfur cluster assembly protein